MNRPTLMLLCGIPGAGKTTYANKLLKDKYYKDNTIHLSSDSIRKELYGDEATQGDPIEVFSLMQQRAVEALNNGMNVIYDSTAVTRKDRAGIIAVCPKFAKIECHIIWASIETCIERDATRERTVGKEVIDRMLKRFQAPYYDEGIDEIKIHRYHVSSEYIYDNTIYDAMRIPHDNPHHTLNIKDHCMATYEYVDDRTTNLDMRNAAQIHDIGKPYVKAFVDGKGNPCEVAHYYQHQCVGAWMSYGLNDITPFAAWLISTHMDPYLNTKYYNKLPTYLKKQVDLLHEADRNAH